MKKADIEREFKERGAADMPEIDIGSISERAVIGAGRPSHKKTRQRLIAAVTGAVLTLVVLSGIAGVLFGYDETEIYIDVNPSVVLYVTPAGIVKELKCLNDDAAETVNPDDYKGKTVDYAAEMLFSALDSAGYLDDNDISISSVGDNQNKNARLMEKVKKSAEKHIKSKGGKGKVYSGENTKNGKGASVSPAKQNLIEQILDYLQNTYTFEELKGMSTKELKTILEDLQQAK